MDLRTRMAKLIQQDKMKKKANVDLTPAINKMMRKFNNAANELAEAVQMYEDNLSEEEKKAVDSLVEGSPNGTILDFDPVREDILNMIAKVNGYEREF